MKSTQTERVRSRGAFAPDVPCYAYNWQSSNPIGTYHAHGGGTKEWMRDIITKPFVRASGAGEIVMSPMLSTKHTYYSTGSGYYLVTNADPTHWERCDGDMSATILGVDALQKLPPFLVSLSDASALQREISTKVLSQRGRSNANTAENLAEWKQTAELIKRPIGTWLSKHRKLGSVANAAKSGTSAYLIWRYGVSPLIKDVSQILENLRKPIPKRETTRASGTIANSSVTSKTTYLGILGYAVQTVHTEKYTVRGMSIDEDTHDGITSLRQLGLDGKSLITLPWELVNKSFVLDWFVNVGDVLGAVTDSIYAGSRNKGSCLVGIREITQSHVYTGYQASQQSTYTVQTAPAGSVTNAVTIKQRDPGLSNIGFAVKSDFRFDKATRVGDAFALVVQQLIKAKFR